MVRERFQKLDPKRQENLFRAAADEFAEHGYDAASLNRVLETAGMSKGSLYYYFEDKADLFGTVLDRAIALMMKAVGPFAIDELTAESFWPTMEQFASRSMEFLTERGWAAKLARSFYRLRGRAPTLKFFDLMRRVTAEVLAQGQKVGVVRTDLPLSFLVESTIALGEAGDRWLLEHWEELGDEQRRRFARLELEMFRRMLSPVDGPV